MSYQVQRPLSGLTSRVYGRAMAPRGGPGELSGLTSRVYGRAMAPRGMLGAAPEDAEPLDEASWRREMLKYQRQVAGVAHKWVHQDMQIRYLQIFATVMIPVSGMFWNWFLKRRGSSASSPSAGV